MAAELSGFRPGRLGDCSDINKARPATRIGAGSNGNSGKIQVYGADCGVPPGAKNAWKKGPGGATSQTNGAVNRLTPILVWRSEGCPLLSLRREKWLHDEAIPLPSVDRHKVSRGDDGNEVLCRQHSLVESLPRRVLLGEGRISQSERFLNRAATSHWQYAAFPR